MVSEKRKDRRVREERERRGRQGQRDFALSCLQECCFIAFSLADAVMNHTTWSEWQWGWVPVHWWSSHQSPSLTLLHSSSSHGTVGKPITSPPIPYFQICTWLHCYTTLKLHSHTHAHGTESCRSIRWLGRQVNVHAYSAPCACKLYNF